MEIDPVIFWNVVLTLIIAPAVWAFRTPPVPRRTGNTDSAQRGSHGARMEPCPYSIFNDHGLRLFTRPDLGAANLLPSELDRPPIAGYFLV